MKSPGIFIDSDFKDYYDGEVNREIPVAIYVRKYNNTMPKGRALAELRKMGVNTIPTGSTLQIAPYSKRLVVYTNINGHKGKGKIVTTSEEASIMFPNNLASPYYEESANRVIKVLQVGKRRFTIGLENTEILKSTRVVSLKEEEQNYNYLIKLPIFSIDYINTTNGVLAVDFNEIQDLEYLGISKLMKPREVTDEIYRAMLEYNKFQ